MYTKESEISIRKENIVSDTPVVSENPLRLDISRGEFKYIIKSEGETEWTDKQYLVFDVMLEATSRTFIYVTFRKNGEEQIMLNYSIIPNRRIKAAFDLGELASRRWFLTPHAGNLKGHVQGRPTSLSEVDEVVISTTYARGAKALEIYGVRLSETLPDFTVGGAPVVDRFGQNADYEWNMKVRSEEQLKEFLMGEYQKAEESRGYSNPDWNEYGGYRKLKLEKTGYFHTEKVNGRSWLVDPSGCAFLSNGVCYGSRMGVHGHVDGMRSMFEWLPDEEDEKFRDAWTTADNIPEFVKRNGKEAGRKRRMFNFARANMIRVFGDEWWNAWVKINSSRLKEWGFNTISVCVNNYFDEKVYEYLKKAKIPYTWTMKSFPKTEHMIFRDFPDVFSEEYRERCREFAKQLEPLADDPYMIGYFINNEPEWLVERRVSIAEELIKSGEPLESKRELVKFLKNKYETAERFNEAWGHSIKEFEELLKPQNEKSLGSEACRRDLNEFKKLLIEEYNRAAQNAVREICPHNMSLGMRYAGIQEKSDFAGSEYHDVFSFNCYKKDPTERIGLANENTEKPCLIGEWMFGASDESLLCSALITCPDQKMRGMAAARYLQRVYSNPQMVGAHYFEYNDQPLLGRFDGEAMPHGLIDVCNQPKREFLEVLVPANNSIYEIALGEKKPDDIQPVFLQSF